MLRTRKRKIDDLLVKLTQAVHGVYAVTPLPARTIMERPNGSESRTRRYYSEVFRDESGSDQESAVVDSWSTFRKRARIGEPLGDSLQLSPEDQPVGATVPESTCYTRSTPSYKLLSEYNLLLTQRLPCYKLLSEYNLL
jgi:hypothetical protein